MEIEAQIQQFISQNLLYSDDFKYDNHASFLQEGIIDSMGVMDLVAFVGSSFGIHVEPKEVTPDNFDSVDKLAGYIRRKRESLLAQPPPGPNAKTVLTPMIDSSQSSHSANAAAR